MVLNQIVEYSLLTPLLSGLFLLFLFIIMIYCYKKLRIFYIILIIWLFSLVIGMESIVNNDLPFSPYFQIFFMLFQTLIFMQTSFKAFSRG